MKSLLWAMPMGAAVWAAACGGDAFTSGSAVGNDGGSVDSRTGDGSSIDAWSEDASNEGGTPEAGSVITVTGHVMDAHLQPMAGVTVAITFADASQTAQTKTAPTAADGSFAIPGVAAPYDAYVVVKSDSNHPHGYVFEELFRADPWLQLFADSVPPPTGDNIAGTVNLVNSATAGIVFVDVGTGSVPYKSELTSLNVTLPNYSLVATWFGGNAKASIYALEWEKDNSTNLPTQFRGYLPQNLLSLSHGGATLNPIVVTGNNVNDASLTVNNANLPSGWAVVNTSLSLRPTSTSTISAPFVSNPGSHAQFNYVVPDVGGTIGICTTANLVTDSAPNPPSIVTCVTGVGAHQGSAKVTLDGPIALGSFSPTAVTTSKPFTWSALPNAVHLAVFGSDATGTPTYYVLTRSATTHIPDFSAIDAALTLPSQKGYGWSVLGFTPAPTMAAAVDSDGYMGLMTPLIEGRGPLTDGGFAYSGGASFVTK
jgi:hypothetical protein